MREVEVLGNLFDALANHRSLDNVFRAHSGASRGRSSAQSCVNSKRHVCCQVSRDLRPRREYLSDFETAFEVDDFDSFHRILVHGCGLVLVLGHHGSDLGNAGALNVADFSSVQGCDIARATSNGSLLSC